MASQPGIALEKGARFMVILVSQGDGLPVITFKGKASEVRQLVKETKAQYFEAGYWSLDRGEESEVLFLDPETKQEAAKLVIYRFIRERKEDGDAPVNAGLGEEGN